MSAVSVGRVVDGQGSSGLRFRAWVESLKGLKMIEGVPEGWELVRIGVMSKGDWAIGGDGTPWQYTKDKIGDEHWPVICMTASGRIENSRPVTQGDVLAALANLRDQQEKLQRRVERLEAEERRQRACMVG